MIQRKHWKHIVAGIAMLVVATLLLYWCFRQIDFQLFWRDLAQASFLPLVAAMGCVYAVLLVNAWQWLLFLPKGRSLSYQRVLRVIKVMEMMANIVPWGNAFVIYHLGEGEKLGKTEAASVFTMDQVAEGFAKVVTFLFVAMIVPIPGWMKNGIFSALIVVVSLYFAVLFFAHRHREFVELNLAESTDYWKKVKHSISKWAHHLHVIRSYKITVLAIFMAIVMKLLEVAAVYLVQVGFDMDLPLWAPFFVVAGINLATMAQITPGNLGIFEAAVFFIYKYIGVEPTQAMSLALFNHLVYIIPMVVPGYWVSIRLGVKLGRAFFQREPSPFLTEEYPKH